MKTFTYEEMNARRDALLSLLSNTELLKSAEVWKRLKELSPPAMAHSSYRVFPFLYGNRYHPHYLVQETIYLAVHSWMTLMEELLISNLAPQEQAYTPPALVLVKGYAA